MRDTIYTRALFQAADAHGGTHALASTLRVPENTLQRWMSGRAQTPLQAFCKVIDLLIEHEKDTTAPIGGREPAAPHEALQFASGNLLARCAGCGAADFALVPPAVALMYTTELRCRACDARVTHGALLAGLARTAVVHGRRKG
ncbi:MAG TPA: hypothetical protein VE935_22360 [Burkholderiales bacterium]|nr:hypothetical protein [Burkholderiales bacterium]